MPTIHMHIVEGRDEATKRTLVQKTTDAISESLHCPKEKVKIIIHEMNGENYAEGGKLLKDYDARYTR